MAAPDFIASAGQSSAGSPSATVVIPTTGPGGSVAAGQKALLVLSVTPAAPTAAPAGWSAVVDTFSTSTNSGGRLYMWETVIGSTGDVDPGDTVTVSLDGNARWALGVYVTEACGITLPVAVFAPVPGTGGNSDGALTSPVATAEDESRAVHIYGCNSNVSGEQPTWTADAATTERVDVTSNHGSSRNATILIADEVLADPGPTTGRTAVSSLRVQPTALTVVLTVPVDRPTATPGADQSVPATTAFTVTVTAAGGAGGPYTYEWRQISGPNTPLSSTTVQSPTATAGTQAETLVYGVKVIDSDGVESHEATTQVTVLGAADTSLPVADVAVSGWAKEPSGAASVSAVLADTSDATYGYVEDPVGTVVLEVQMSGLTEPVGDEPYTVSWRPSMIGGSSGSATVTLKEGSSTVIAVWGPDTWSVADVVQQFDHQLTEEQVASISDWFDLRIRIEGAVT